VTRGAALVLGAALLVTPSCGTFITRVVGPLQGHAPPVGWWPGMAVAGDAVGIAKITDLTWGGANDESGVYSLMFLLNLPVDLVIDTVLLPFDLLGGLAGWEKGFSLH
jgi:uncharacterized protein YceK